MTVNEITYYEEEVNGHHFRMVSLPGGIFEMGDPENISTVKTIPVHQVELSPFYIGEFLVTQALWKAVMGNDNPSRFKGDQRPVELVSWHDLVVGKKGSPSFIYRLNELMISSLPKDYFYRLPTEAEWEYAARANSPHTYSGSNRLKEIGWYSENSQLETKEVGLKNPNEFYLYDMCGNVREWCQDGCSYNYSDEDSFYRECFDQGTVKDPVSYYNGGRCVLRGGSWFYGPQACRVSHRVSYDPTLRNSDIGFRLVLAPH